MDTYNGTYFVLLMETATDDYQPVAHATGHSLNINRSTRDTSSKSVGVAAGKEYGRYDWDFSVDALISFNTGVCNISTLRAAIIDGTKMKIITALLDYETAGKAPPPDATPFEIRDATGDDSIDSATTTIESENDELAMTSVFTTMTPEALYGVACITGVSETSNDGETATFSISGEGDGALLPVATAAFA